MPALVRSLIFGASTVKDAAGKEAAALQARQQYLTTLATQRCAPGYRPPQPLQAYAPPQPLQ